MKKFKDWKIVLLDTTCLCSLFRSEKKNETVSDHDLFVRKLIEYLNNNKTGSGEDRTFLVSSVTVAEMVTNEDDSDKIKKIMRVLNSKNVEFIDFDLEVAMGFNSHLKSYLNSENLHKIAKEIGFKTNEFAMAREWITKDYMIIMSGINYKADAILTADKKTFYPIAKNISASNCVLTYSEIFDQSEQFIFGYKENEVETFIKGSTKNSTNEKKDSNGEATKKENQPTAK